MSSNNKYSAQQLFAADFPEKSWEAADEAQQSFYEKKVCFFMASWFE